MLIDTHAHLTMSEFSDLTEVLERASAAGVSTIINASFDEESSQKSAELARNHENIYASAGIHPHHADRLDDDVMSTIALICDDKKVVAVGETGLDYFENPVPKEVQKAAFARHIGMAAEKGLPLILHGRDADADMLEVLSQEGRGRVKGVFHCFSGDPDYAKKVLDAGFMISFTGVITFKNAHIARETVKYVPMDRMMIETDCPYLAPQAVRGKRNEPANIVQIADKISELKNISFEETARITSSNAADFFLLGKG